jgi:dTDP-glucose 4,6-dehydratase
MRVLVTGGAGFIGSNFVRHLLSETSHYVTTLDKLTYAGSTSKLGDAVEHSRHELVEGDVRDYDLVSRLVTDVDAVVNFAAESHVDRSIDDSEPFLKTNVGGTRTLLEAARRADVNRFVQISTDEVYGETLTGSATESDLLDPRNPYAATKASADLLVGSYHSTYELDTLVVRMSNSFGPRQHSEKLVPKFVIRVSRGESLPLYGDGSNVREWTFVEDSCRAIETVLNEGEPGKTYNVGSGVRLRNREVVTEILDVMRASEDLVEYVDDRPGHDQRYALDASKVTALGWEPQYSFREGLERTVEYYL